MSDTTITLSAVGIDGTGNSGELAYFDTANTIRGASGITVIQVAGASTIGFGAAPSTLGAINIDGATYNPGIVFSTNAVIRGGTNGFQIQNSGGTRNNVSINDAGTSITNGESQIRLEQIGSNVATLALPEAAINATTGAIRGSISYLM